MSNYIRSLQRLEKERGGSDDTINPAADGNTGGERAAHERAANEPATQKNAKGDTLHPRKVASPVVEVAWPDVVPLRQEKKEPRSRRFLTKAFDSLQRLSFLRRLGQKTSASHALGELAFAQLLDSLRALESAFEAPGIVLAAAGDHAAVGRVLDGLGEQARRKGIRLLVARLVVSETERYLERESTKAPDRLEINRTVSEDTLRSWFERATAGHDLLIVEAPPLSDSVDAALLARAGDGLAIVAEPLATSQAEFETAVERAKAAGCFLLGLVMSRHTHWLPGFLRNFFNAYPRLIRRSPRRG